MLPVGGYRIDRLKKAIDSEFVNFHTKRKKQVRSNVVTEEQLEFLKADAESWPSEDGSPCAHRRPRKYTIEPNLTWSKLHARYSPKAAAAKVRVLSYIRWTQKIHCTYPGLRLTRTKEDVCDACVRIETQQLNPDISSELHDKLLLEKSMHLDAAIGQRN